MTLVDFLAPIVLLLGFMGLTLLVAWLLQRMIDRDMDIAWPHKNLPDLRRQLMEREAEEE